jgi:hypothetical protein
LVAPAPLATPRRRRWVRHGLGALAVVVAAWLLTAYLVLPLLWSEHEKGHH